MSRIQQIIKCPVCNRMIATDSPSCDACEKISLKKIENDLATFIDFRPDFREKNLKIEARQQRSFTTQLFASSFFPWFYEKILPTFWAMGLRGLGGIEREYQEVIEFFGQDLETVMDLSCGTGIMARKLAKGQFYQLIIALDYSESMLNMFMKQIDSEKITSSENLVLIRGDAESIPLISNSVDAIYAGAAMHCWQNPQKGVEEVYRVLRPGGKIFATTFTRFLPRQKLYCFSIEELWSLFQEVNFQQELLEIKSEGIYLTVKGIK